MRKAFLLTDIEASTQLWLADPLMMEPALRAHDRAIESQVGRSGGTVFFRGGDSIGAAFDSLDCAITAAVASQHQLRTTRETAHLRVRMGILEGSAVSRSGTYFGVCLHILERLLETVDGGCLAVLADLDGTPRTSIFERPERLRLRGLPGDYPVRLVCFPRRLS